MKYRKTTRRLVSRRSVLAATGAVVAATTLTASPAFSEQDFKEADKWKELIGQAFYIRRGAFKAIRIRLRMTLVSVDVMTEDDPNRPAGFRTPFTLTFVPGMQRKPLVAATYWISNNTLGTNRLFVNETMNTKFSNKAVVQAVFC